MGGWRRGAGWYDVGPVYGDVLCRAEHFVHRVTFCAEGNLDWLPSAQSVPLCTKCSSVRNWLLLAGAWWLSLLWSDVVSESVCLCQPRPCCPSLTGTDRSAATNAVR